MFLFFFSRQKPDTAIKNTLFEIFQKISSTRDSIKQSHLVLQGHTANHLKCLLCWANLYTVDKSAHALPRSFERGQNEHCKQNVCSIYFLPNPFRLIFACLLFFFCVCLFCWLFWFVFLYFPFKNFNRLFWWYFHLLKSCNTSISVFTECDF